VQYQATLTGGTGAIRNAATNTPMATTSWTFTTDVTAPTALPGGATSPVARATGVGRLANVVTEFSEQVSGAPATRSPSGAARRQRRPAVRST